jgi:hypothetical protein
MSSTQLRPLERTRPLVAVVCTVPLLGEAVRSALEFADVQTFAERGGDLDGLLRWLRPDALIVDSHAGAEQAAAFARETDLPVVHLAVQERELRFYRGGTWTHVGNGEGPTPESVRNVVAGALFAKEVNGG